MGKKILILGLVIALAFSFSTFAVAESDEAPVEEALEEANEKLGVVFSSTPAEEPEAIEDETPLDPEETPVIPPQPIDPIN